MNGLRGATRFKNDGITTGSPGSGTVTSVGLALDATGPYVVQPATTPVTTSGVLTADLQTQNPNLIFAGPASGGSAKPTFRSAVPADIPNLDTGKLTSGTLPIARGGTNSSTALSGGVNVLAVSNGTGITELVGAQVSSIDGYITGNQIRGINGGALIALGSGGNIAQTAASTPPVIVVTLPGADIDVQFNNTFQVGSVYNIINWMTANTITLKANDGSIITTVAALTGMSLMALVAPPVDSTDWIVW